MAKYKGIRFPRKMKKEIKNKSVETELHTERKENSKSNKDIEVTVEFSHVFKFKNRHKATLHLANEYMKDIRKHFVSSCREQYHHTAPDRMSIELMKRDVRMVVENHVLDMLAKHDHKLNN